MKKTYDGRVVLDVPSLSIGDGCLVSIVGRNGAGKTTLLETMGGLRAAESSCISVNGRDVANSPSAMKQICFMPQRVEMFDDLTVEENVSFFAKLHGLDDIDPILSQLNLDAIRKKRYRKLSGGMKQRTCLACIICGDPKVLLLDEPMSSLDPSARREIWPILKNLAHDGMTIIATTHVVQEAIQYSDSLIVMRDGRVIYSGAPNGYNGYSWRITIDDPPASMRNVFPDADSERDGSSFTMYAHSQSELWDAMTVLKTNSIREDAVRIEMIENEGCA